MEYRTNCTYIANSAQRAAFINALIRKLRIAFNGDKYIVTIKIMNEV